MSTKPFRCLAKSDDFERKLRTRFVVADSILDVPTTETASCALLSKLPTEVLLGIFDSIEHAPSQVALALTCRQLACLARSIDLTLSLKSSRYAGYLPMRVFDVPELMTQLRPWMPGSLRLCGHCLTYRPAETEYWKKVPGYENNDFWIQKTGWSFKHASWRRQTHDICPYCHWACSLSDYIDCDGCRALGRLGDVDWSRITDFMRSRTRDTGTSSQVVT